jgi:hypothetical protein
MASSCRASTAMTGCVEMREDEDILVVVANEVVVATCRSCSMAPQLPKRCAEEDSNISDLLRLAMIREGEGIESVAAPESTPAAAGSGVAPCRGLVDCLVCRSEEDEDGDVGFCWTR